jgi:hypothetical protein
VTLWMSALGKQHRDVGTLSTGGNGPKGSFFGC